MELVTKKQLTCFLHSKGHAVKSMRIYLQTKRFVIFTFKESNVLKQGYLDKFSKRLVLNNFSYEVYKEIDKLLKEVFCNQQC